jgi:hypothetical protein
VNEQDKVSGRRGKRRCLHLVRYQEVKSELDVGEEYGGEVAVDHAEFVQYQ